MIKNICNKKVCEKLKLHYCFSLTHNDNETNIKNVINKSFALLYINKLDESNKWFNKALQLDHNNEYKNIINDGLKSINSHDKCYYLV